MTYSAVVLADNPVSYWRLGEPSGTLATDQQGANNGTYVNAPTLGVTGLLTGDTDTAVTFAAASAQRVLCKTGAIAAGQSAFTVELWMKASSNAPQGRAIYCERAAAGNDIFKIVMQDSTVGTARFLYRDDAGTLNLVDSVARIDDLARHHIVARLSGTTFTLNVDNVATTASRTAGFTFTNAGLESWIAGDKGDAAAYFPGTVDEVAIYLTKLSDARVTAHYNEGLSPTIPPSGGRGGRVMRANDDDLALARLATGLPPEWTLEN